MVRGIPGDGGTDVALRVWRSEERKRNAAEVKRGVPSDQWGALGCTTEWARGAEVGQCSVRTIRSQV